MKVKKNETHTAYVRYGTSLSLLIILLGTLFVWNVNSGSVHLTVKEIFSI